MKKLGRITGLWFSLVLSLGWGALAETPASAKTKVFVAMARVDPFLSLMRDSLLSTAAKDSDIDLTLVEAHDVSATQISQVKAAIADKTDVLIVLSVDADSAKQVAALAADAKVPLIYLNVLPPIDRFDGKVAIVASNDLVAGRLQMRLVADRLGDKGNIVILRGAEGHPAARDRTEGVKEILATKPSMSVVENETGHWKREDAEKLVTNWLDSGVKIDGIVANNDEMAIGAISALQKKGIPPGKIAVAGVDGTKDALSAMKSGYLTVTFLQDAKGQSAQAMADAKKLANHDYAQLYDWVPYEIIIPANMNKFSAP